MWLAILAILGGIVLLAVTFIVELLLAVKQSNVAANRPSTWITLVATTVKQFFFNIGRFLALLPDVFGWIRRFGYLIHDLFFPWITREVAEKAIDDIAKAFHACFKAPLAYFDGIWDGLCSVRLPWITRPMFVVGALAVFVASQIAAINYNWPAPLWITWYAGLLGSAAYYVIITLIDIPTGFGRLIAFLKDLVPEAVYIGLLKERARLAAPYIAISDALLELPIGWRLVIILIVMLLVAGSVFYLIGKYCPVDAMETTLQGIAAQINAALPPPPASSPPVPPAPHARSIRRARNQVTAAEDDEGTA